MLGFYDFSAVTLAGETVLFRAFAGNAVLIVNTASQCGFTPQYDGLEKLYRKYSNDGFVVLAFPCNQFGGQEPGDEAQIAQFCSTRYDVTFPVFEKVEVNGPRAAPIFSFLKAEARGLLGSTEIKWNFTKFLVDRKGGVIGRYGPTPPPAALAGKIEALL